MLSFYNILFILPWTFCNVWLTTHQIKSSDKQTIHLVIRELVEGRPASAASQVRGQSPSPIPVLAGAENQQPLHPPHAHVHINAQALPHPHQHLHPHPLPHPHQHQHHVLQQSPSGISRRTPLQQPTNTFPQFRMPSPAPVPPQIQALQQAHQFNYQQYLNAQWVQHQREVNRVLLNHQRANGLGDPAVVAFNPAPVSTPPVGVPLDGTVVGPQPETHTVVRETVGPGGQQIQVLVNETIFRAPAFAQPQQPLVNGPLSALEVHNIIRGADSSQAALSLTNAMQQTASSNSLGLRHSGTPPTTSGQPSAAPATLPVTAPYSYLTNSGRATPDLGSRAAGSGLQGLQLPSTTAPPSSTSSPEVYILSSPRGPRALLIHGGTDVYYTPYTTGFRMPTQSLPRVTPLQRTVVSPGRPDGQQSLPQLPQQQLQSQQQQQQRTHRLQQLAESIRQQPAHTAAAGGNERARAPGAGGAEQRPVVAGAGAVANNNINNNVGLGPIVAQIWPHFWLLLRLAAFVWWFTSPSSSWSRWAAVVVIAVVIFIFNTGILNGFADQAWGPLRRHLENLIPLADPAANPRPTNPPPAAAAAPAQVNPNPNNANNWLVDAFRRVERASLLFLASIAPGVAERHIAHLLETEARAVAAAQAAAADAEGEAPAAVPAPTAAAAEVTDGEAGEGVEAEPLNQGPIMAM